MDDLLKAAAHLCAEAGYAMPHALHKLAGGRNNRVFRVEFENAAPLLLKNYNMDTRDSRDRLGAETAYLCHANNLNISATPTLLAWDHGARISLMTYVQGYKLEASAITQNHIEQAADFIIAINKNNDAKEFQSASEACFSIVDHIATIDRRVARLNALDATAPFIDLVKPFIAARLQPLWSKCRASLQRQDATDEVQSILSPSDFGFHNVLADKVGVLSFIDFEYAGRDDPAKLTCDFFCCPDIPAPLQFRALFIDKVRSGLSLDAHFSQRCDVLLDAYRIKWACIILNDFLDVGEARRSFANAGAREQRCEQQLIKARTKLDEITFPLTPAKVGI